MYNKFFGFRENPFQLIPNPFYLFMGASHEEALASLSYAIEKGEGFVEITGEVGTGKTTLIRSFLDNPDISMEVAYIFNPKLDSIQLLKVINDEFGIPSDADNTKDLIDLLNEFLIEKTKEGNKVVLIIDEAQNLTRDTLEQIRLLSNIETTQAKLLQIVLVGQHELSEKLDSYELRQLRQRISLSFNLCPLTLKEVENYIYHRIHLAGTAVKVKFTRSAIRKIYRYSMGIPRLINIVCDRSLLIAYGYEKYKITAKIARAAIKELRVIRPEKRSLNKTTNLFFFLILAVFCIALSSTYYFLAKYQVRQALPVADNSEPYGTRKDTSDENSDTEIYLDSRESRSERIYNQPRELTPNSLLSRQKALRDAIVLWNGEFEINSFLEDIDSDIIFFKRVAGQNGLSVNGVGCDISLLKRLNVPAILRIYHPKKAAFNYLALSGIQKDKVVIGTGDDSMIIEHDMLESLWDGKAYVVWKNFFGYPDFMSVNSRHSAVITLQYHLKDIGFSDIQITGVYDYKTRESIMEIQEKNGINVDGFLGPLTKIVIYNEKKYLRIPHISE